MSPTIEMGTVKITLPDKPSSKNQRYVKIYFQPKISVCLYQ